MRRFVWSIVFVLTGAAFAQVSVPAVVVDDSRQSVHGLQKSDFSVSCGKGAELESVEEVAPVALPNFSDTNAVFILYDVPSLDPPVQGKMARLLLAVLRKTASERLPVTVLETTDTGIQVAHDLSVDPAILGAALDRLESKEKKVASVPTPPGTSAIDFQKKVEEATNRLIALRKLAFPTNDFYTKGGLSGPLGPHPGLSPSSRRLESLQLVAKLLQRSRKRKLLIWLTGHFPVWVEKGQLVQEKGIGAYSVLDPVTHVARGCRDEGECGEASYANPKIDSPAVAWTHTVQSLNDSRISVFPIGISTNAATVSECCIKPINDAPHNGLDLIARATGGFRVSSENTIDLSATIADLRHRFGSYYLLSITPGSAPKGSWRECTVAVSKPSLTVAAPGGFFSEH